MLKDQKGIELKTPEQLRLMRRAGEVLAQALDAVVAAAQVGVSTAELDTVFAEVLAGAGAQSNFLGYHGFPAHICASVNEQVVHAIPSTRPLKDGDILSIDGGAVVDGWHADSARTVIVGRPRAEDEELSHITRGAMWAGIAAMATAKRVGHIGAAIDDFIGEQLTIVEEFTGHGIGSAMHMPPEVLNFRSRERGPALREGMVLAIEPILMRGTGGTRTLEDGWTVVTADGSRAAQWEHTVALHSGGIWVLTAPDGGAEGLAPYGITPVEL